MQYAADAQSFKIHSLSVQTALFGCYFEQINASDKQSHSLEFDLQKANPIWAISLHIYIGLCL